MRELRPYQKTAVQLGLSKLTYQNGYELVLDPGLGKTAVSCRITAAMQVLFGISRVLVTAPEKVMRHWIAESAAWGAGMQAFTVEGTPAKRLVVMQQNSPGIHIVSHGNLDWLSRLKKVKPFDLFIIDEGSKFRNWSAKCTKAAIRISSKAAARLILTGSPMPNCPSEFFSQMCIMDRGKTLGRHIGQFRSRYMHPGGYQDHDWIFDEDKVEEVQELIAPWILRQDSSLLDGFPEVIEVDVPIHLPAKAKSIYQDMEQLLYTELTSQPLMAMSGSSKYSLCRQIASGGYYDADKVHHEVHAAKTEAVANIADETDSPLLVVYCFRHEHERLKKAFPYADSINGDTDTKHTEEVIKRWQQGKTRMILAQSQSISHGIDGLQHGGHTLVWYTMTNKPDDHDQLVFRLARSGQANPFVTVHNLIAIGTLDRGILSGLRKKQTSQQAMLEYFREKTPEEIFAKKAGLI